MKRWTQTLVAPGLKPAGKMRRKTDRNVPQGGRRHNITKSGRFTVTQFRGAGQVNADPDDNMTAHHLQQNTGQLAAIHQDIIGPFERKFNAWVQQSCNRIVHGKRRNDAKACCGWAAHTCFDHSRSHEVSGAIEPFASLPSTPSHLAPRDKPLPFNPAFIGTDGRGKVGVGRSGLLDQMDVRKIGQTVRNSEAAALSARSVSDGVRR